MAKKIYHIPLDDVRVFIKNHKDILNKLLNDNQQLQYSQRFGKSYYDIQIEKFIIFFKMDKNLSYALQTINYLSSKNFFKELFTLLNFNQFEFEKNKTNEKDFFYGFCYILYKKDTTLFERLFKQFFIHFHLSFNTQSNINVDYKEMAKELAKSRSLNIKESFGENEKESYFKLCLNGDEYINLVGNSIKTIRKKAYRKLFYVLLDFTQNDELLKKKTEAYELLLQMKNI